MNFINELWAIEFVRYLVTTLIGGGMALFIARTTGRETASSVNADTIIKLSKRIDELEERDTKKEERIEGLENELRRFRNAYAKAIVFIHEKLPLEEIPNFLDTEPRMKSISKRVQ